jgi:hypothetical protein
MMAKGTPFVTIPTQEIQRNPGMDASKKLRSVMNPVPFPFTFKEGVLMAVERPFSDQNYPTQNKRDGCNQT